MKSETKLRDMLRQATSDAHQRAEAQWMPNGGRMSAQRYQCYLTMLLSVHQAMGVPAAHARGDLPDIEAEDRRVRALCSDLNMPKKDISIPVLDPSYAWGVGYVLNGSALGAKEMLQKGRIQQDWPNAYVLALQSYANSGQLARFFARLNDTRLDNITALQGAQDTFGLIAEPAQKVLAQ
ncbi:MAG: biliverdin-producing heme oxygenase [Pseudomonadota bacterium]